MLRRSRASRLAAIAAIAAVLATACADGPDGDGSAEDGLEVVVTTSILGDIVGSLVGEEGTVEVIIRDGADPHSFAPSAAQAAAVREADLVVANGLGLEESLVDLLGAARDAGVEVLELAPQLDPLPWQPDVSGGHEEAGDAEEPTTGDSHADEESDLDPHVWFDPVRMAEGVRILAEALAEADDRLDDAVWAQRGADYATRLVALDEEVRDILSVVPPAQRVLVTNHDAIGYLAARYDFELLGAVIPGGSTVASASAERIAELAGLVRDTGVPAIFSETTADDRLAQTLAREVGRGVTVVSLFTGALGEPGTGADTYPGLLRTDAQLIADALAP